MKYQYKYTPEIILFIYLLVFLGFKAPNTLSGHMINGDGKGYYAYLPAIFIYKDLQFNFQEKIDYQYYPGNTTPPEDYRNPAGSKKVDKFFPGLAIIWLPFFLAAHILAILEVFPKDGYSLPYQYAIALSALLFLWLGARWLRKLLKESGSGDRTAAFITLMVTLGTNLLFYSAMEPSMPHVYSFALMTGFAWFTFKLFHDFRPKWFVKSLLALTLIVLIRPTNGLIVLLIPLFAGSLPALRNTISQLGRERKALVRGIVMALVLLTVPFILWHLQTGRFFVYSYGNEIFNFTTPRISDILFSFNRGWFIYTPMAFIALFGFIPLFLRNRPGFFLLILFMAAFVYVCSCWWLWTYNSQFGQRVFIDILFAVALLLLFLYQALEHTYFKNVLTGLLVILAALNLFQLYQQTRQVLPADSVTKSIYQDSFFSLVPVVRSYIPEECITSSKTLENDMEKDKGGIWMNPRTRTDKVFHQGHWSSRTDNFIPYSVGPETRFDSLFTTKNRVIRINSWVYAPIEIAGITLVVDFQLKGKSVSHNQVTLDRYIRSKSWTETGVAFYLPRTLPKNCTVKVYFYNPSACYQFYLDDLVINFLSLKDDPSCRKIDGVVAPNLR